MELVDAKTLKKNDNNICDKRKKAQIAHEDASWADNTQNISNLLAAQRSLHTVTWILEYSAIQWFNVSAHSHVSSSVTPKLLCQIYRTRSW